jgi:hypothetical protein
MPTYRGENSLGTSTDNLELNNLNLQQKNLKYNLETNLSHYIVAIDESWLLLLLNPPLPLHRITSKNKILQSMCLKNRS